MAIPNSTPPKRPSLNATRSELENFYNATDKSHTGRVIISLSHATAYSPFEAIIKASFTEKITRSGNFSGHVVNFADLKDAECLILDHLNVAILGGSAAEKAHENHYNLRRSHGSDRLSDGLNIEFERMHRIAGNEPSPATTPPPMTWGLTATNVAASPGGKGVKVAILDTGFDSTLPDFKGRTIISASFIAGEDVSDGNGHGTHVAGTACGPKVSSIPNNHQRYGIAYESTMLIGKVLSNAGTGTSGEILAGINWAVEQGAAVINLSHNNDQPTPSDAYTAAATAALAKGALIIASAGNKGGDTLQPANSPSIMSISAMTEDKKLADFSCFGKVELIAPGVDIWSAAPSPTLGKVMSGTSMACPHVTGIAALYASETCKGNLLWQKLKTTAKDISLSASQQGNGLVQLSFT